MRPTCLAFALLAIAFLIHLTWWRIHIPRRHTRTLMVVFFGTLLAGLACVSQVPGLAAWRPHDWLEAIHVCEFFVAMTLAYVVAYSAIEERSPSMSLLTYVSAAGDRGRSEAEMRSLLASVMPVERRLKAMVRDGMLRLDAGTYRISGKGRGWARLLGTWRRLAGLPKGG